MTNFSNTESLFIRYAAPTICGIKPANLFTLSESQFMAEDLQKWESNLKVQNLCMAFFKTSSNRWMIFIYDYVWIRQIISTALIQAYLKGKGYTDPSNTLLTLKQLFNHLQNHKNFPHEIGLFLGYPIEDVIGFEENHGKNCKYCGYWKSYSDTSEAKTCCAKYKWCSELCKQLFDEGLSVPQIIKKYKEAVNDAA